MSDPQEIEPELDDLTREQLSELAHHPEYRATADVLDDWIMRRFGKTSSHHGVGLFLDLLAAEGFRVTPIDPSPSLSELLPEPSE